MAAKFLIRRTKLFKVNQGYKPEHESRKRSENKKFEYAVLILGLVLAACQVYLANVQIQLAKNDTDIKTQIVKQDSVIYQLRNIALKNQIMNEEIDSLLKITAKSITATNNQSNLIGDIDQPNIELIDVNNKNNGIYLPYNYVNFIVTNKGKRPAYELKLTLYIISIDIFSNPHLLDSCSLGVPSTRDVYNNDSLNLRVSQDSLSKDKTYLLYILKGDFFDQYYNKKVKVFHIYTAYNIQDKFQRLENTASRTEIKKILKKISRLKLQSLEHSFDDTGF